LGYNTTNGQVVYSGTNPLTFTNPLAFGDTTNTASIRTNLGGTTVGDSVFTATNAAAAATAIGLGTANEVTFNRVQVGGAIITAEDFSGGNFAITAGHALTFASGGTPGATLTNLGLGAADNVTFSNITASGTLGVTGNATFSGTANLAPSQTADSADSLMTRDLSDARFYPLASYWLKAGDMDTFNGAGTGQATWAEVSPIFNMVTPFSRAPRVVPAADGATTEGIFPIPVGWPAGATVRTTTYFALAPLQSTTDSIFIRGRAYWTTNSSILTPVRTAMSDVFPANTGSDQLFTGTGTNAEYFAVTNTFTFATNANPQNRSIMFGRSGTQATDTATNTIYFIGSHVELLP
jgi:hypothetical protein